MFGNSHILGYSPGPEPYSNCEGSQLPRPGQEGSTLESVVGFRVARGLGLRDSRVFEGFGVED